MPSACRSRRKMVSRRTSPSPRTSANSGSRCAGDVAMNVARIREAAIADERMRADAEAEVLLAPPVAKIVAALLARPREVADLVLRETGVARIARWPSCRDRRRDRRRAASRVRLPPAAPTPSPLRDRACRARRDRRRCRWRSPASLRNSPRSAAASPRMRSRLVRTPEPPRCEPLRAPARVHARGRADAARHRETTARRC